MTKKDKLEKCKSILYSEKIIREDKIFLINEVFKLHKNYKNKIGSGAKDIIVKKSIRNTKCFFIVRKDGTLIDISFYECLHPSSKKTTVNRVFRNIVEYQIKEFRNKNNIPSHYEIDHFGLEFKDIVKLFMVGKSYEDLYLKIIDENNFTQTFNDLELIKDFQKLHLSLAKLQGISKKYHKIKTYKWN